VGNHVASWFEAFQLTVCFLGIRRPTAAYGIGTHLTNDFKKRSNPDEPSKPLNIVVKIHNIDGLNCVKLTDDRTKYTGDKATVEEVAKRLAVEKDAEVQRG
jgi:nicotinate phosphoribosyltransferase